MKRFFYVPALILLYLLTTAKSCNDREQPDGAHEEARLTIIKDSIRSTFAAETLSVASLHAFEDAAVNKFSDLCDYQAIVHDTSVALPFREKAQEMIRGIFISGQASAVPSWHAADSIWVQQPLQRTGNSIYSGKLGYTFNPKGQSTPNNQSRVTKDSIDFSVIKREKIFGTGSLLIWDVFLGKAE